MRNGSNTNDIEQLKARVDGLESRLGPANQGKLPNFSEFIGKPVESGLKDIIILARACVLSYRSKKQIFDILKSELVDDKNYGWFEDKKTDTQGFWFSVNGHLIFVFRGTEGIKDVAIDVDKKKVKATFDGKGEGFFAHRGFLKSAESVWPDVRGIIDGINFKKVWFTGHSLGGAVATLTAYVVWKYFEGSERIGGLCTIGQPRVMRRGKQKDHFQKAMGNDRIFRIYRVIDPVPQVPIWRYSHVDGTRCYIKRNGKYVRGISVYKRAFDQIWTLIILMVQFVLGHDIKKLKLLVSYHFSQGYLDDLVYSSTAPEKKSIISSVKLFFKWFISKNLENETPPNFVMSKNKPSVGKT